MKFVHVTSAARLQSILSQGLRAGSYFCASDRTDIAAYYAETVEDEGGQPVRIEVDAANLDLGHMVPDHNGIEEPLTFTLGMSEEQVLAAWNRVEGTWQDSLELIGTCRYMATVPPSSLHWMQQDAPAETQPHTAG